MTVIISFEIEPDEPDDNDPTGMSEEDFQRVHDTLSMELGADNIEAKKKEETA